MARASFTLKTTLGTASSVSGSFLQAGSANIGTDDTSALKADGYAVPPELVVGTSFIEATPTDYGTVTLNWALSSALSSTLDGTPRARSLVLTYSLIGPPQTLGEGSKLVTITAANTASSYVHTNLPSGSWVYYSLFVKYESTAYRSWYEKVAETQVLIPRNYGSVDALYRRIPLHYRLEDQSIGATNALSSSLEILPQNLQFSGPLYRMLEPFGWEIDTLRTFIDYTMQQKDPYVANTEMLDLIAEEIGLPIDSQALGAIKLRDLIANYAYLTQNEGLPTGIEEFIASLMGSNVEINYTNPDLFSATHHAMSSLSTTTSASTAPATNQWLLEVSNVGGSDSHTLAASTSFPFAGFFYNTSNPASVVKYTTALSVKQAASSGSYICCLKTKIQNVSKASRIYMDFGATYGDYGGNGASVLGCLMSASVTAASAVALTGGTITTAPDGFVTVATDGYTNIFEHPTTFGVVGDGSLTTGDFYLHVWIATSAQDHEVFFMPTRLKTLNRYPYTIDVYSQRLNLVRDPQFTNGLYRDTSSAGSTSAFWRTYGIGAGPFLNSATASNGVATLDPGYGASANYHVTTYVNNSINGGYAYIPIRRGTDYYFSVDDISDTITSVYIGYFSTDDDYSLTADIASVVASGSLHKSEALSGGGFRKWWKITVPGGYPYYPLNNYVYNLTIVQEDPTGTTKMIFAKPLLEPYIPGEYFDGNSDNGGWLNGPTNGGTNSDYRWGTPGAHTSFSYYTSDYRRSVVTTTRMIEYIVPVTESGASTNLRFNRIPGYVGTDQP